MPNTESNPMIPDCGQTFLLRNHEKFVERYHFEELMQQYDSAKPQKRLFMFILVTEGEICLMVDCKEYCLQKDQLLLVAPRMNVNIKSASHDFASWGVCMDPMVFDYMPMRNFTYQHLFNGNYKSPVLSLQSHESQSLQRTFESMENHLDKTFSKEMITCLISFLSLQIGEVAYRQAGPIGKRTLRSDEVFRQFRKLLAHYYKEGHNISYYADLLNISQTYLSRAVRKASGQTVNDHITTMLLNEAKRELIYNDSNIKEIAEDLGFSDQSSFSKFFKKETGMSPIQFRLQSAKD